MTVIDAHQHFWKYDPGVHTWMKEEDAVIKKDFLPDALKIELEHNGVNGCVAVQADQSDHETGFLVDLAKAYPFIRGVVGWTDLQGPKVVEYLEMYADEPLVKGFRHLVQDEPDPQFMLRPSFQQGIAALSQYNFTYDVLVFPHQLEAALALVKKFPGQAFVIDHLAKPGIQGQEMEPWRSYLFELGKQDQVYCKISGMVTEADWHHWNYEDFVPYLDVALEAFGPERLMYGSDWPVCLLSASYESVKQIIDRYVSRLTPAEQSMIMGENATRFYQL